MHWEAADNNWNNRNILWNSLSELFELFFPVDFHLFIWIPSFKGIFRIILSLINDQDMSATSFIRRGQIVTLNPLWIPSI